MMIKFFLGVAIVGFCAFCGFLFAKKYRQRKLFFGQLSTFNERFINEISYYRRPLVQFASAYAYKGEFSLLLEDFFKDVDNAPRRLDECLEEATYSFLKKEEKGFIKDYFLSLGRGDSASQKTHFSSLQTPLQKQREEAEATCKKYADLYVKLGFLFGLLVLILII